MLSPALRGFSIAMENIDQIPEDIKVDFDEDQSGNLLVTKSQAITDEYLKSLRDERFQSRHRRTGEYHRAASIPVNLHELWLSQGYDCTREPIRKTLAKLKAEGLDYFITTDKQL